ncbi:hypothetical protein BGZ73_004115, partial [Actinomortierella ambigua]
MQIRSLLFLAAIFGAVLAGPTMTAEECSEKGGIIVEPREPWGAWCVPTIGLVLNEDE